MAIRNPLVLGPDGLPQELQPGDKLPADILDQAANDGLDGFRFWALNLDLPIINAGGAVALVDGQEQVVLAVANGPVFPCVGLMQTVVRTGFSGWVQTAGLFTLQDWSQITGAASLVPNRVYFLDPAFPGRLTVVPPTAAGKIVQIIGRSISDKKLSLSIGQPILL